MHLVLQIVLTVLCIGVSFSSCASTSISDVGSTEKKVPESETPLDHNKVQTLPQTLSTTHISQPITTASITIKDEPVVAENKTSLPVIGSKNITIDAKNASSANSTVTVTPQEQKPTLKSSTTPTSIPTTASTERTKVSTTVATPMTTAALTATAADHGLPTTTAQEKQFDGLSFIGGIVLTVGLTVIGFIAFKFYKSGKIGRNYRTI